MAKNSLHKLLIEGCTSDTMGQLTLVSSSRISVAKISEGKIYGNPTASFKGKAWQDLGNNQILVFPPKALAATTLKANIPLLTSTWWSKAAKKLGLIWSKRLSLSHKKSIWCTNAKYAFYKPYSIHLAWALLYDNLWVSIQ